MGPRGGRSTSPLVVRAQCGDPRPKRAGGFWRMSHDWQGWAPEYGTRARERDPGGGARIGRRRVYSWVSVLQRHLGPTEGHRPSAILVEEGRRRRVRVYATSPGARPVSGAV